MQIQNIDTQAFRRYGRVLTGLELDGLLETMQDTPLPDGVVYVPSVPALEALSIFGTFREEVYGGLPVQIGYCNGNNHLLNAVEYHRSSEIDVAATDLILILGSQQDIEPETFHYDTSKMEAFFVPKGTAVELFATTLHYAPANAGEPFRCVVVLPRNTNEALNGAAARTGESRLLFARNKWLIAHAESGLDKDGAFLGLTGENLSV